MSQEQDPGSFLFTDKSYNVRYHPNIPLQLFQTLGWASRFHKLRTYICIVLTTSFDQAVKAWIRSFFMMCKTLRFCTSLFLGICSIICTNWKLMIFLEFDGTYGCPCSVKTVVAVQNREDCFFMRKV